MKRRKIKPLGTINQELAACIRAFKKHPKSRFAWCCHHKVLQELLGVNEDKRYSEAWNWMGRIKYIQQTKPPGEKAVRFRNFRPVIGKGRSRAAFNREWPHNTWNGYSIFS